MLMQEFPRTRLFEKICELGQVQHQLNRRHEPGSYRTAGTFPPVNVWTGEDSATVTAEIPGVAPEDIDISVVNEKLTIRGERRLEPVIDGQNMHRKERGFGQFTRLIQLPFQVDSEKVTASFKKGILQITLPRSEKDRPRKIAVRAE